VATSGNRATKEVEGSNPLIPKSVQETLAILRKPFPANEIKEREGGGGKMLRYVSGASVIRRLIEATDGNYSTRLVSHEYITITTKRRGSTVSLPAMLALVEVEIPNLGSKQGFGIQVLEGGEDMYKGAYTDGIKKAATQFGVGLDDLYETEEIEPTPPQTLSLIDEELKKLLNANGIKTQGALSKAMLAEFNTTELTPTQIETWRTKLRVANPTPTF
jgi:hypothetical protein